MNVEVITNNLDYLYLFLFLGIALCMFVLALLHYVDDTEQNREQKVRDAEILQKEPSTFWNGVERRKTRDMALTAQERDERRAAAMLENVNTESAINIPPDEVKAPLYNYPNVDGFPFEGTEFEDFKLAMLRHGFAVRFVMASREVQVLYEQPNVPYARMVRHTYRPPHEVYPANLLHTEGLIKTALWAMRRFKKETSRPELDAFVYL